MASQGYQSGKQQGMGMGQNARSGMSSAQPYPAGTNAGGMSVGYGASPAGMGQTPAPMGQPQQQPSYANAPSFSSGYGSAVAPEPSTLGPGWSMDPTQSAQNAQRAQQAQAAYRGANPSQFDPSGNPMWQGALQQSRQATNAWNTANAWQPGQQMAQKQNGTMLVGDPRMGLLR